MFLKKNTACGWIFLYKNTCTQADIFLEKDTGQSFLLKKNKQSDIMIDTIGKYILRIKLKEGL
jgi:hypothetical protein